jgi:hypothetical protein
MSDVTTPPPAAAPTVPTAPPPAASLQASVPGLAADAHLVGSDASALASALGQLLGAAEVKAKQEIHDHIDRVLDGLAALESSLKSHITGATATVTSAAAGKASHLVTAGLFFLVGAGAIASAAALFLGLKAWLG